MVGEQARRGLFRRQTIPELGSAGDCDRCRRLHRRPVGSSSVISTAAIRLADTRSP